MELQYGNIKIHLSDNLSYKWTIGDSGCIRGYAYVGEEFLEGETLLRYLVSASSQEDAIQKICSLNGFYNLILQMPFGVLACVDQVRSMPLFYRGNKLFDTLDEKAVSNWALDENALAVYRNCVFTPNSKTLFQETFQIQTGYYLLFDATGAHQYPHFKLEYTEKQITDIDEAVRLLDENLLATARRTIEILDGRTAVMPLSGGHDSRILAFYLKRLGLENIIAYSFGQPGNKESVRSQKVAELLGIPWHFVNYDPEGMKDFYRTEFRRYAMMAGNGTSIPHIMDWYAVYRLKEEGILPENCVFVPGYGGDFTAGEFIWRDAVQMDQIPVEVILQFILKYEFVPDYMLGREKIRGEEDTVVIRSELQAEFQDLRTPENSLSGKAANQVVEQAILTGWYSKFIANVARVYDFYGYKWLMPFFERSQFETWSRIDNSLRVVEAAYFELARRVYPDALNAVDFALFENITTKLDQLLAGKPEDGHYALGYFDLGEEYYRQIREQIMKGPNVYVQEDYLEILRGICRRATEPAPSGKQ